MSQLEDSAREVRAAVAAGTPGRAAALLRESVLEAGDKGDRRLPWVDLCEEVGLLDLALGLLDRHALGYVIESSGYKGFHVWSFLESPAPADAVYGFAGPRQKRVRSTSGNSAGRSGIRASSSMVGTAARQGIRSTHAFRSATQCCRPWWRGA